MDNPGLSVVVLIVFFLLLPSCSGKQEVPAPVSGPNILVLVADDLGYSDPGCFGGEISTPNLDALAATGIRFSRFHTAPMCAPSRAMLLTGTDNHIAGMGRQNLAAPVFGYEGELTNRVVPIPALLRQAGYHTYMAGKWHLGAAEAANPHAKGFEHSFVLLEGVGNHYSGLGIFKESGRSHYTEDGQPASWPEGKYSTDLYTDKLISYINRHREDGKPFFAYAAYTAPHWPLQADSTSRKKYEGRYDEGYEVLRQRRLQNLQKAGMIPEDAALPPLHPLVQPWDSLSDDQQATESRKMELYAAMVDNLDANIGRLLDYLKETGQYGNTLIIFMSDNGAAGEDYYNEASIRPYLNPYYSNEYENMGSESSLVSYGPPWAEAGSAAFRYYKEYTTNGGIITPMILSGPGVSRKNTIHHGFVTVMDLAPTIYQSAGVSYPEKWEGDRLYPLRGTSLLPFATGQDSVVHPSDYGFGMEHAGYAMYRKGSWKITNSVRPFEEENFELFNLEVDPGESRNLREEAPDKYRELLTEWRRYASETGVQLPR